MRAGLLTLLCLGGGGVAFAVPAAAQTGVASCPDFAPGRVVLDVQVAPLRTDYSQSIRQLAQKPGRRPTAGRTANAHIMGLAAIQYNQQWQVGVVTASLGQGRYCGAAQTLTVTFGYDERTVYVARELPQGSCIHGEVLAHEMRHVAVDEQLLREYVPALKRRLEDVVARARPVQGRSERQVMAAIEQPIRAAMRQLIEEFGRERNARQARVDTPAEYDRIGRSCNGEINRYIGGV
ncbi:hypothetical protein [Azospirillum isscasi]|uniref:DUF922 domain-containing protein n=1 Tax=Azospirillum isscasi TaxID=3053926 RepID=A0ABU0WNH6_9PROT|nr:hypothetical protein [Azospirillum isscasi]MDQ2104394.1 hypothetical protein [Azospirillum isscasi]